MFQVSFGGNIKEWWEPKMEEEEREEFRRQKKREVPVQLKVGGLKGMELQPYETKSFFPAC